MGQETIRYGDSWIKRIMLGSGEHLVSRDRRGVVRVYPIVKGMVGALVVSFIVITGGAS